MKNETRRSLTAVSLMAAALAIAGCQSAPMESGGSAMTASAERSATAAEIEGVAVGRTINNAMTYNEDGSYVFRGGNPGRYTISQGQICVSFESGGRRCDRVVTSDDGETFTMINRSGERFPFG